MTSHVTTDVSRATPASDMSAVNLGNASAAPGNASATPIHASATPENASANPGNVSVTPENASATTWNATVMSGNVFATSGRAQKQLKSPNLDNTAPPIYSNTTNNNGVEEGTLASFDTDVSVGNANAFILNNNGMDSANDAQKYMNAAITLKSNVGVGGDPACTGATCQKKDDFGQNSSSKVYETLDVSECTSSKLMRTDTVIEQDIGSHASIKTETSFIVARNCTDDIKPTSVVSTSNELSSMHDLPSSLPENNEDPLEGFTKEAKSSAPALETSTTSINTTSSTTATSLNTSITSTSTTGDTDAPNKPEECVPVSKPRFSQRRFSDCDNHPATQKGE